MVSHKFPDWDVLQFCFLCVYFAGWYFPGYDDWVWPSSLIIRILVITFLSKWINSDISRADSSTANGIRRKSVRRNSVVRERSHWVGLNYIFPQNCRMIYIESRRRTISSQPRRWAMLTSVESITICRRKKDNKKVSRRNRQEATRDGWSKKSEKNNSCK